MDEIDRLLIIVAATLAYLLISVFTIVVIFR